MEPTRTLSLALLIAALAPTSALAQKSPDERIARVEQGLLPAVRVKGRMYAQVMGFARHRARSS